MLPNPTITSHVNMKFICQAINLFRCHPTVAKHANLLAIPSMVATIYKNSKLVEKVKDKYKKD